MGGLIGKTRKSLAIVAVEPVSRLRERLTEGI